MPYYNYPYRRRYRSRWPYRSWRRFGVSSAQKSGTRRFSISIPVEGYRSVGVSANSHTSYSVGITPFYNSTNANTGDAEYSHHVGNLIGHQLFTTYCQLYDEVKLNSMTVTISVDQVPVGTSGVKVISCVDRHVTLNDIRTQYLVANMSGAAESDSKMFSSLQNAKVYRYFAARDVGERTTFFDSTLGQANYTSGGNTYTMAGPLEFIENTSLFGAFNPIMFVGFSFSAAPAAAGTVYFQYKVTYNLTFRNPKYGGAGGAKGEGFSEMKKEVVDELKSEAGVSEGYALRDLKRRSESDEGREVEVLNDDETLIDGKEEMEDVDEMSKEELIEALKKLKAESK